jgi:ABC-type uncharacterized transport system ATPase subunit
LFELRIRDNAPGFLAALESLGFIWRQQQTGDILVTKPPEHDARVLFEVAKAQNTQIRQFVQVRQSLEDIFMKAISS